jgi:Mrp family chromosome partitioning ATPase
MVQIHDSMDSAKQKADPRAALEAAVKSSLDDIKRKFIVMSGKGGVGKTSVSVNIATALANHGARVGLMDVDVHGPDIPRMLGLKEMLGAGPDRKILPIHKNRKKGSE